MVGLALTSSSVFGVSIMRFVIVAQGWGNTDITYKFAINYIWRYADPHQTIHTTNRIFNQFHSIVEINVGIVCACAPCLRALVGRYVPALMQLGRRHEAVDLYTIPVSQVARRLPSSPACGCDKETGTDSVTSSVPASSWRGITFGSRASSSREQQV